MNTSVAHSGEHDFGVSTARPGPLHLVHRYEVQVVWAVAVSGPCSLSWHPAPLALRIGGEGMRNKIDYPIRPEEVGLPLTL